MVMLVVVVVAIGVSFNNLNYSIKLLSVDAQVVI